MEVQPTATPDGYERLPYERLNAPLDGYEDLASPIPQQEDSTAVFFDPIWWGRLGALLVSPFSVCQDRVVAFLLCYALLDFESDAVRNIAKFQIIHLASLVLIHATIPRLANRYLRDKPVHAIYSAIRNTRSPGMKFFDFIASLTGMQAHVSVLDYQLFFQDIEDAEVRHGITSLLRELQIFWPYSRLYPILQPLFTMAYIWVMTAIGAEIPLILVVKTFFVPYELLMVLYHNLHWMIVRTVADGRPEMLGYQHEYVPDRDIAAFAFANMYDIPCFVVFDFLGMANVGCALWVMRHLESHWTQILWIMLASIFFFLHVQEHRREILHSRDRLAHLFGVVYLFSPGVLVITMSFFSPVAFRLYAPICDEVESRRSDAPMEGIPPIIASSFFHALVFLGYGLAIYWPIFAVKTTFLLIGAGLTALVLLGNLWLFSEGRASVYHVTSAADRGESPKSIGSRACLISFIILALSGSLPFILASFNNSHGEVTSFLIHDFDKHIDGEYSYTGMHNRLPYYATRGDVHDIAPVIYHTPATKDDSKEKWVIGICDKPFQPQLTFHSLFSAPFSALWAALSESETPLCDGTKPEACLAYTTKLDVFLVKNSTTRIGNYTWKKWNNESDSFEDTLLKISSTRHRDRKSTPRTDILYYATVIYLGYPLVFFSLWAICAIAFAVVMLCSKSTPIVLRSRRNQPKKLTEVAGVVKDSRDLRQEALGRHVRKRSEMKVVEKSDANDSPMRGERNFWIAAFAIAVVCIVAGVIKISGLHKASIAFDIPLPHGQVRLHWGIFPFLSIYALARCVSVVSSFLKDPAPEDARFTIGGQQFCLRGTYLLVWHVYVASQVVDLGTDVTSLIDLIHSDNSIVAGIWGFSTAMSFVVPASYMFFGLQFSKAIFYELLLENLGQFGIGVWKLVNANGNVPETLLFSSVFAFAGIAQSIGAVSKLLENKTRESVDS